MGSTVTAQGQQDNLGPGDLETGPVMGLQAWTAPGGGPPPPTPRGSGPQKGFGSAGS